MSLSTAYAVQKRRNMASGGTVCSNCGHTGGHQAECPDSRMAEGGPVDRIMAKRMSKGGEVANDTPPTVDDMDADYDVLAKDDDLGFHETGANSGDEDGGMSDDDMIDRIMMKRRRDRNPVPA